MKSEKRVNKKRASSKLPASKAWKLVDSLRLEISSLRIVEAHTEQEIRKAMQSIIDVKVMVQHLQNELDDSRQYSKSLAQNLQKYESESLSSLWKRACVGILHKVLNFTKRIGVGIRGLFDS